MKQKITIKVEMKCEKCREKTMQIAATAPRVISVTVEGDDVVTVEGNDVDSVVLTDKLRKKVGSGKLIGVEEIKEKKEDKKPKPEPQPGVITYHQYPYAAFPPPPAAAYYCVPVSEYDNSSCSIM